MFISACQHKSIKKTQNKTVPLPDLWCSRCWAAGNIAFLGEGGFEFRILQPSADCLRMLKGKMNGVPFLESVLHIPTCLLTCSVYIKGLEYINIIFRCLIFDLENCWFQLLCQMAEERAVCALC